MFAIPLSVHGVVVTSFYHWTANMSFLFSVILRNLLYVISKPHGRTGEIPLSALKTEQLLVLPAQEIRDKHRWETRKVTRDGFISFDGAKYGTPWQYSGRELRVRTCGDWFEAYDGEVRIVQHKIEYASGKMVWLKGQYEGLAERNGIASPFSYARQWEDSSVEIRPLSIYDKVAGVI
jgi:hypothetical protein